MAPQILHLELKTGYNHNGQAWIGLAQFSRSGRTVYFNGKAFKQGRPPDGDGANYVDVETGEGYWISGVKKRGSDRHPHGGGKIFLERDQLAAYLSLTGNESVDPARFDLVTVEPIDVQKFTEMENEKP